MITIIHGDNTISSRGSRQILIAAARKQGKEPHFLDGTTLTSKDLETALTTQNLFSEELVIIDNLLTRLRSQEKTKCITYLANCTTTKEILLWDHKEVTPANLKLFQASKIVHAKETKTVFQLADNFMPANNARCLTLFHETLTTNAPELVFGMLIRRLGDLIIALSAPDKLVGAPWQKGGLLAQAKYWTLPKLLEYHSKFLVIDEQIKTGSTKLDLVSQLDLLLLTL
jgi:hypothetical protein